MGGWSDGILTGLIFVIGGSFLLGVIVGAIGHWLLTRKR